MLEYATVVINYAAAIACISRTSDMQPVVLIEANNTNALSWAKKASNASTKAKALLQIQCCLMLHYPVGQQTEFIKEVDNTIAEFLSKYKPNSNDIIPHGIISQEVPQLTCCRRFHPSPNLLSKIMGALLTGSILDPLNSIAILGHVGTD